ncbi:unnamed protein product, partial [Iphiclides podalirius]
MSFAGKVVLVTNSSSIGTSIAVAFAKEGAFVALVGENETKLSNVLKQCEKYGSKCLQLKSDITRREDAVNLVQRTVDVFGRLDVLVNNAAICKSGGIFDANFMEAYDETIDMNLRAVVHITNLAAPYLVRSRGSIVNISSVAPVSAKHSSIALSYFVSKAALEHFTRAVATELAEYGVRANIISTGPVRTDFCEYNITAPIDPFEATAHNRLCEADEIAELALYLSSDKAKCITGSNYVCDNGFLLKN